MKNNKVREHNSPIMQELLDETTPEDIQQTEVEMELIHFSAWLLKHYNITTKDGLVGYTNSMDQPVLHWDVVFHYLKREEKI
jgi:hypothetical protein